MNILQLSKYYDPVNGGIELVAKMMTKVWREAGDHVHVIAFSNSESHHFGEFGEEVWQLKLDLFFISTPINFHFLFKFEHFLEQHKIDQIYVHLPNPFMHEIIRTYSKRLRQLNIKVLGVYHSDIVNKSYLGDLYQAYFKLGLGIYDKFICSSQKLLQSSEVLKDVSNDKVTIIPFCIDNSPSYLKRDHFTKELVAIGRMVPYKGFEFMLKAISKTNYKLTVIGDGPLFSKLKKYQSDQIKLVGEVNDEKKMSILKQSSVLIVSSQNRAEAYGMTIVEAFSQGLPVVSTNINSGVTFLVQNEITGLVYETGDEAGLIKCLDRLNQDNELFCNLAKNAYDFYESVLSFKRFSENIINLKVRIENR